MSVPKSDPELIEIGRLCLRANILPEFSIYKNTIGRHLYNGLHTAIIKARKAETTTEIPPPTLTNYQVEAEDPQMAAVAANETREMGNAGDPTDQYIFMLVTSLTALEPPKAHGPAYGNYLHAEGKAILCMNNHR
jgi:hypothetical protein